MADVMDRGKIAFKRAYLEFVRNMATVVAYGFAAGFLFRKHPMLLGSELLPFALGFILYIAAMIAAYCASDLFTDAIMIRFDHFKRFRLALVLGMLGFVLCLIWVPYIVAFKLDK
ncbi:hypothetical protein ABZR86_13985 [Dyella marensis]|nr:MULTISPECIES: hypothetical protein [Dyella]